MKRLSADEAGRLIDSEVEGAVVAGADGDVPGGHDELQPLAAALHAALVPRRLDDRGREGAAFVRGAGGGSTKRREERRGWERLHVVATVTRRKGSGGAGGEGGKGREGEGLSSRGKGREGKGTERRKGTERKGKEGGGGKGREGKGREGKGRERKGGEGRGGEGSGVEWRGGRGREGKGREGKGKERNGERERNGKERREGKGREGKGKERKGGRGGEGRGGEWRGGEGRGGKGREGKGREGKGREGKGREGKGTERRKGTERKGGKGREGKGKKGRGGEGRGGEGRGGKGREGKGKERNGERERKGKEGRKGREGKEREGRGGEGREGKGRERNGTGGKGRERKGRKGTEGIGRERKGREGRGGEGRERKGRQRKGKEREGRGGEGRKRRKGRERKLREGAREVVARPTYDDGGVAAAKDRGVAEGREGIDDDVVAVGDAQLPAGAEVVPADNCPLDDPLQVHEPPGPLRDGARAVAHPHRLLLPRLRVDRRRVGQKPLLHVLMGTQSGTRGASASAEVGTGAPGSASSSSGRFCVSREVVSEGGRRRGGCSGVDRVPLCPLGVVPAMLLLLPHRKGRRSAALESGHECAEGHRGLSRGSRLQDHPEAVNLRGCHRQVGSGCVWRGRTHGGGTAHSSGGEGRNSSFMVRGEGEGEKGSGIVLSGAGATDRASLGGC